MERVKLIQEELGALVNEQTKRTLFLLTFVTVLALPINLIAGALRDERGRDPVRGKRPWFRWRSRRCWRP